MSTPKGCSTMVGLGPTFPSVALLCASESTQAARWGEHAPAGVKRRRVLPCPANDDEDEELLALLQASQVQPSSPGRASTGDMEGASSATVPVSVVGASLDPIQHSDEQPSAHRLDAEPGPNITGAHPGKHSPCKTTVNRGRCSGRSLTTHDVLWRCLDSAGAHAAWLSDMFLLCRISASSGRRSQGSLQERSRCGWAMH